MLPIKSVFFLKTRLGLAIRATGNNSDMVKSSSINPVFTTVIGLCVALWICVRQPFFRRPEQHQNRTCEQHSDHHQCHSTNAQH